MRGGVLAALWLAWAAPGPARAQGPGGVPAVGGAPAEPGPEPAPAAPEEQAPPAGAEPAPESAPAESAPPEAPPPKAPKPKPKRKPRPKAPKLHPKALKPDKKHEVAVVADCALAVRFAKRTKVPVLVYLDLEGRSFFRHHAKASFLVYEDYSHLDVPKGGPGPGRVALECYDEREFPSDLKSFFSREFRKRHELVRAGLSQRELCGEVGLEPLACAEVADFAAFTARPEEEGAAPYPMYWWKTRGLAFLAARRGKEPSALEARFQSQAAAATRPTVDLLDPKHRYYHW